MEYFPPLLLLCAPLVKELVQRWARCPLCADAFIICSAVFFPVSKHAREGSIPLFAISMAKECPAPCGFFCHRRVRVMHCEPMCFFCSYETFALLVLRVKRMPRYVHMHSNCDTTSEFGSHSQCTSHTPLRRCALSSAQAGRASVLRRLSFPEPLADSSLPCPLRGQVRE